jgi:hypothetical protein
MGPRALLLIVGAGVVLVALWAERESLPAERATRPGEIIGPRVEVADVPEPLENGRASASLAPAEPTPARPRFRVSGTVLDARGEPARGAVVRLYSRRVPRPEDLVEETVALLAELGYAENGRPPREERYRTTPLDDDGAYVFEDVVPAYYDLGVAGMGSGMEGALRQLPITADLVHHVRLAGALVLEGTVERRHPGPVSLELAEGDFWPGGISYGYGCIRVQELDEAQDAFHFAGLASDHYRLRVRSPQHASQSHDFELTQSVTDAVLQLRDGLVLAGRIEVGFETEFSQVWVALGGESEGRWYDWWDGGEFRMTNLLPQTYRIELQGIVSGDDDRRVRRELAIDLRESVEDFHYLLEDDVPAWLSVELPGGAPLTEGTLTATATEGASCRVVQSKRVRLESLEGTTKASSWGQRMRNISGWSAEERLALPAVSPGEWTVRLELLGYEPWETTVEIESERTLQARPVPRRGRMLRAAYAAEFYRVETRPSGPGREWELAVWRDGRIRASHTPTPGVELAWLPAGVYDLRVTSNASREVLVERVRIEDSLEPLVVAEPLEPGARIEGHIETPDGRPLAIPLYLWRAEGATWKPLRTKEHLFGSTFAFQGLAPGRYRASANSDGELVCGEWELGTEDLVGQVVVP